jgi:hypothetical protein
MVGLLIYLLIFALVVFAAFYIINNLIPEPFRKIASVIGVVLVCIVLIVFLMQYSGGGLAMGRLGPCR